MTAITAPETTTVATGTRVPTWKSGLGTAVLAAIVIPRLARPLAD